MASSTPMLEVRVHSRRGRGLYTTRHVKGGEVVLAEAPILLVVPAHMKDDVCATCLCMRQGQTMQQCSCCKQACFCSPACMAQAQEVPWIHGPDVCSMYAALGTSAQLDEQELDAGRFLAQVLTLQAAAVAAGSLQHAAGAAWEKLWALQGSGTEVESRLAVKLHPLLPPTVQRTVSESVMADLLRKEQLNSYGILAASWYTGDDDEHAGNGGAASANTHAGVSSAAAVQQQQVHADDESADDGWGRVLRGSALYGLASLINHECNPNIARFDSFDVPGPASMHVVFKAMHDLPAGTEVMQSYCPVAWDYEERQEHCQDVYGFKCSCQRCKVLQGDQRRQQKQRPMPACALEQGWSLGPSDEQHAAACGHHSDMESSGEWQTDDEAMAETVDQTPVDASIRQQQPLPSTLPESLQLSAAEMSALAALTADGGAFVLPLRRDQPPRVQPDEKEEPGPLDATYLQLYLLKYVCAQPGCFGTMAPQAVGSSMFECSVCGQVRSEQEFLAELDA